MPSLVAALVSLLVAAGCAGGSAPPSVGQPSPSVTPSACPGLAQPSGIRNWPRPLPADLPRPPGSNHAKVALGNTTLTVVSFDSPISLREAVLFVLGQFPKKGFLLGRGDAELNQADAPFGRQGFFGQVRINGSGPCSTQWLVAVGAAQGGTSPLLPAPSGTPSPLPFGP